jgi:hypothetical protein
VTSASWPDIERITPATDPQALMTSSPTWKSSPWKPDSRAFLDHRSFLGAIRLERGQGPVKHVSVCFELSMSMSSQTTLEKLPRLIANPALIGVKYGPSGNRAFHRSGERNSDFEEMRARATEQRHVGMIKREPSRTCMCP